MLPMYREPHERPDFGIWVDRYGRIIDGDEGQRALFGDASHCFQFVDKESYCHIAELFFNFVRNGRRATDAFIRAVSVSGNSVTFRVHAELVAYDLDDLWIAVHGWDIDHIETKTRQRG